MNRRNFVVSLCALVCLCPGLALAEDGEGGGGDSHDDGGSEDSESGGGGGEDSGGGNDNGGGDGAGNDDHGHDSAGEPESSGLDGGDHDHALRAVETDGALSLQELLVRFRRQTEGRVVDVSLSGRSDALIYIVTFVDHDGRVRRQRFNARTGDLMH